MQEWVALKAKMYAFNVGEKEKTTGKGCPKTALTKYTTFDVYKHVLLNDAKRKVSFRSLKSPN